MRREWKIDVCFVKSGGRKHLIKKDRGLTRRNPCAPEKRPVGAIIATCFNNEQGNCQEKWQLQWLNPPVDDGDPATLTTNCGKFMAPPNTDIQEHWTQAGQNNTQHLGELIRRLGEREFPHTTATFFDSLASGSVRDSKISITILCRHG